MFQWMSRKGIEYQTSATGQHLHFGADGEQCSDLAALAAFACDLDREIYDGLNRRRVCRRRSDVELVERSLQRGGRAFARHAPR